MTGSAMTSCTSPVFKQLDKHELMFKQASSGNLRGRVLQYGAVDGIARQTKKTV